MRLRSASGFLGGVSALFLAVLALGIAAEWMGDPVARQLGPEADALARHGLRAALDLDAPAARRLLVPIWDLLRGDLGTSVWLRRPVADLMLEASAVTALLAAMALPVGIALGIALGLALASARERWSMLPLILLS